MKLSQLLLQIQVFFLLLITIIALWQRHRMKKGIAELTPLEEAPLPEPAPQVSIVLPVRNEQEHLDACLASLLAQDYPNFDILVVDDGSTDATPALLAAWARRDPRVRVQRIETLPAGWAGKAHALHTGVLLTQGEWLLFTDADTRHAPHTLRRALAHALAHRLDLLTLFTDSQLRGTAARLLTAIGASLLALLATPGEMRDPRQRTRVLAVGQYMLVRRSAYLASEGYSAPALRSTFSDDITLAWHLKRCGCREEIVAERGLVFNDQWTSWRSAWAGMRKSNYGLVASSPLLGILLGLALILYGLLPPMTLLQALLRRRRPRQPLPVLLALTSLGWQIETKRLFEREYRLPAGWALTAPLGWSLFGLLMLDTARLVLSGRGATWKGRSAPPQHSDVHPLAIMGGWMKRLRRRRTPGCLPFAGLADYLIGELNGRKSTAPFSLAPGLSAVQPGGHGLVEVARQTDPARDSATY
jgi:chlorobactene glucosyltransferase